MRMREREKCQDSGCETEKNLRRWVKGLNRLPGPGEENTSSEDLLPKFNWRGGGLKNRINEKQKEGVFQRGQNPKELLPSGGVRRRQGFL